MFERDPVLQTAFIERPRQCVPVAVIMYNRVGSLTDAVDLRLVTDTRTKNKPPMLAGGGGGGYGDVSVVVGQVGRRRVVVSRPEKRLNNAATTSEPQQTSCRTVLSCPSGEVTKITINNDRERSHDATATVGDGGCRAAPRVSIVTSPTSSPAETKTAVPQTAEAAARSQYSHLIRRRKIQSIATSPRDRTPAVLRTVADPPSPQRPREDDAPLTLLQRQKTVVGDITKHLSVELSAVTTFLRVTKPAHVDDRERIAMLSMQRIHAAFQRLSPACLVYRRFCRSVAAATSPPAADALRARDSRLRRCRDKLTASFSERRDVILQTPIAGEQRLFTFVWLQRHAAAIIDCINDVADVLESVQQPPTSGVETTSSSNQPASSIIPTDREMTGGHEVVSDTVELKPDMSLDDARVQTADVHDQLTDNARPPSLTPAMKTDIVASSDEPPVLQPCNGPRLDDTAGNVGSLRQPSVTDSSQRLQSPDDQRCSNTSETRRVTSSSSDRLVVSLLRPLTIKQEQEDAVESCSTSLDAVPTDASETLERSKLADNDVVADIPGLREFYHNKQRYLVMQISAYSQKETIKHSYRMTCTKVLGLYTYFERSNSINDNDESNTMI